MESSVSPPNYNQSKKSVYVLIVFFIAGLLLLIKILLQIFPFNRSNSGNNSQVTATPKLRSATETPRLTPTGISSITKTILYIRDNNIWSVQSDGTLLRQLTRDGDGENIIYQAVNFKNENEVSFARCQQNQFGCEIVSKNLLNGDEKVDQETKEQITNLSWDNKGATLAYIGTNSENLTGLTILSNNNSKKSIVFEQSLGRGGGLDDEVSIQFSPDSKYILVVNTITQPNLANNETTIWIVSQNGDVIASVSKKFATDAIWENSSTIVYRSGTSVFRKGITTGEQELGTIDGVDLIINSKNNSLYYWATTDSGNTSVKKFSLDDKTSTEIVKNIIYAQFIEDKKLVGVRTTPDSGSYFGFTTNGLVVYDLETNKEILIDSSSSVARFVLQ